MMMTRRMKMKAIFTYRGREYGYRLINGHVYNYNILNEWNKAITKSSQSAEYCDMSDEDKEALVREKMELCHDCESSL